MNQLTLWNAAMIYVVYLRALHMPYEKFQGYVRCLRHVLTFYGYRFPLSDMTGSRVLQYADIYDPYDDDPVYKLYGQGFWKFIHWMKRNQMIPAWTEPEKS